MYVRANTTQEEILARIESLENELNINKKLTACDRKFIHEELDYLDSFVEKETY